MTTSVIKLADVIKTGLPLNKDGTRMIRWGLPVADIIADTTPEVRRTKHQVLLTWQGIQIPQLPLVNSLRCEYVEGALEIDRSDWDLTLSFDPDKKQSMFADLTKVFGPSKIDSFQVDRSGTETVQIWEVPNVVKIYPVPPDRVCLEILSLKRKV